MIVSLYWDLRRTMRYNSLRIICRNKILTKQFTEMSNKQIVDELHNENK